MQHTLPAFDIKNYSENQVFDLGEKAKELLTPMEGERILNQQFVVLHGVTMELGKKIGRVSVDPDTEEKSQADKKRDRFKIRLYEMTRIALDDPESESIQKAAAIVQEVLNRRPVGFQNLIHGENSTELKTLLKDLGEPDLKKALDEAGLTKWVNALALAQKEFQAIEDRQDARQRTEKKPRTLAEIRRDFNETLRAILGNLAWGANHMGSESEYAVRFRGLRNELAGLQTLEKTRVTLRTKKEKTELAS